MKKQFRKSVRLPDMDYSQEAYYFITICTDFKKHILGEISNGQSHLTVLGEIVKTCWEMIEDHFPSVRTDAFIAMPNHLHGILKLTESGQITIPTVIQNFKSVSTRRINNVRRVESQTIWQRNYYERIIRTEKELSLIRLYIKLNPLLWERRADLEDLDLSEDKLSELLSEFQ
jgi:putative transposase